MPDKLSSSAAICVSLKCCIVLIFKVVVFFCLFSVPCCSPCTYNCNKSSEKEGTLAEWICPIWVEKIVNDNDDNLETTNMVNWWTWTKYNKTITIAFVFVSLSFTINKYVTGFVSAKFSATRMNGQIIRTMHVILFKNGLSHFHSMWKFYFRTKVFGSEWCLYSWWDIRGYVKCTSDRSFQRQTNKSFLVSLLLNVCVCVAIAEILAFYLSN